MNDARGALENTTAVPALPARPRDGHKGTFGRVVVVAGSPRYTGAAVLAARAALRTGCGLAAVACPATVHPWIAARLLCETSDPLPDVAPGVFGAPSLEPALAACAGADAVALGPGLSADEAPLAFARSFAARVTVPTVIDADGLNAFAGRIEDLREGPGPRVVTPHPGEAARLLGRSTAEVSADREGAVRELAERSGAVAVLKGAGTLVCDGSRLFENRTGNPGMATGGAGDVLTGIVAALLAQGLAAFDAAVLGVHLHGKAGDLAAARMGEPGLIATDLLDFLPLALASHPALLGAPRVR